MDVIGDPVMGTFHEKCRLRENNRSCVAKHATGSLININVGRGMFSFFICTGNGVSV